MKECWDVDPNVRPNFRDIVMRLSSLLIMLEEKTEIKEDLDPQ